MQSTELPELASAVAKPAHTDVLPVPPLPDSTAISSPTGNAPFPANIFYIIKPNRTKGKSKSFVFEGKFISLPKKRPHSRPLAAWRRLEKYQPT
jgi:hypothetical protein